MLTIEKNRELKLENLLYLRKRMTAQEMNKEMTHIGQQIMDIEIMIPLDKKVALPAPYGFKEVFHLVHAIYARHMGNPATIQNTYNQLMHYMKENQLQQ